MGATFEVIDWLVAPAQQAEFVAHTGFSPSRTGTVDEPSLRAAWADQPALRVAYDQLRELPGDAAHAGPAWGPADEITVLLYGALTDVVEGADLDEVLTDSTARANALLAEYDATR